MSRPDPATSGGGCKDAGVEFNHSERRGPGAFGGMTTGRLLAA
jgi:hypothetical protein